MFRRMVQATVIFATFSARPSPKTGPPKCSRQPATTLARLSVGNARIRVPSREPVRRGRAYRCGPGKL